MENETIEEKMKERLRGVAASLDPRRLIDEIRTVQHHLAAIDNGLVVGPPLGRDADLEKFLESLTSAWQEGEVRPTHRATPRAIRPWRTRADPSD